MYYFLSYHGAVVESVPTERDDGVQSTPEAAFGKTRFSVLRLAYYVIRPFVLCTPFIQQITVFVNIA